MNTNIIKLLFITCLFLVLTVSSAFSQGKGRVHKNNSPSGWEKGEKKGWNSDVPPGEENRFKKKAKKMNKSENFKEQKSNPKKLQEADKNKINHKNKKMSPTIETHKNK
jgi:heme/copper-type cytochrome/quinol oxidase subunit 1